MSHEVRLNKAIAELEKAGAYDTWRGWRLAKHREDKKPPSIVECLSEAEKVLEVATRKVTKHNGAGDNLLTESTWPEYAESGSMTESADAGDPRVSLIRSYMITANISESDARKVLNLPPAGLSRRQAAEFSMSIACGISREQAEKLARQN